MATLFRPGVFVALVFFCTKGFEKAVIATGVFLFTGIVNLILLTPSTIQIGPLKLGPFQPFSLGVFFIYIVLNLISLFEIKSDYKERKRSRQIGH